jgi:multidrug efflux pump subunit AcrA (membrane-fusion protein)
MFAKGDFVMGQTNTIAIPQQALVLRDGFNYVFVINNTNKIAQTKVSQVKVQTGKRIGNLVEIVGGLSANQNIVASGGSFLSDNDIVKVVTAKYIVAKPVAPVNTKKLMQLK